LLWRVRKRIHVKACIIIQKNWRAKFTRQTSYLRAFEVDNFKRIYFSNLQAFKDNLLSLCEKDLGEYTVEELQSQVQSQIKIASKRLEKFPHDTDNLQYL